MTIFRKPFESKEVLARVKAVLRRTEKRDASPVNTDESKSADVITYTGFSVDKIRYVVTVDGKEIYTARRNLNCCFSRIQS